MERRTIREVAYRSQRTVQRKRKAYTELFLSTCKRFPTEAEYPPYELIPVRGSGKQPVEASTTGTTQGRAKNSETIEKLRNGHDKNLSKSRKNDNQVDNHMSDEEENIDKTCTSDVESGSSEGSDGDEMYRVINGGTNEIEKRHLGNFDCNAANNDNDVESEESQDETVLFDVTDESSDDESDRDQNNECNVENVDETGGVNEIKKSNAKVMALSVKRGKIVTLKDNVREDSIFMCIIAIAVRHCLNLITIITFLRYIGKLLVSNTIPKSKRAMWRRLGRNEDSFQTRYLYCRKCLDVIGRRKLPVKDCFCKTSGPGKPLNTVGFFVTLNLIEQMKRMFSIPDFIQLLRYPQNRKKMNRDGIEDIYDGKMYKDMQKPGRFLSNEWNFSLTINTDGCQVAKSSRVSAWPILLTINELPPHARKRFMILAGVWVDSKHPDLNAFMKPFVEQLHVLYNIGIAWKPNGLHTVWTKFVTTICCVDSVARSSVLNMTRFNGKYGCPICYTKGRSCGHKLDWVYPTGQFRLRTDREMRADMEAAMNSKKRIQGFIGNSILRYIPEFDLHEGVVIDSMHNMWLGVGKKLTQLLLNAKRTDPWYIRSKESLEKLINDRLTRIRTPSRIARKPRGIENCNVWKANEWRNWVLYYCIPCLKDLIPDEYFRLFCYFSEAAHILNSESVDMQGIGRARMLIEFFVEDYQVLMGLKNMTYNLHILRHVPDCVANWGPLWTHSAFIYEGYNRQIMLSLNSPTGRQLQIMNYYVLKDYIRNIGNDAIVDPEDKQMIEDILKTGIKKVESHDEEYRHYKKFEGFGNPIVREPSATEVGLLLKESLTYCDGKLNTYKKATMRGLTYVSEEGDSKRTPNCDKYVFTFKGLFARIDTIASFVNHENLAIDGAFVTYFKSTGNNIGAGHLYELIESTTGFITTEDKFTPAIVIKVDDQMHGVKMTNVWETD